MLLRKSNSIEISADYDVIDVINVHGTIQELHWLWQGQNVTWLIEHNQKSPVSSIHPSKSEEANWKENEK